jgi:biotin synthase-like enzyme
LCVADVSLLFYIDLQDGGIVGTGETESVLIACLEELREEHDKETVKLALETLLKLAR